MWSMAREGEKETNKTGMQHLDVGDTRLLRAKKYNKAPDKSPDDGSE
jgi:hypothetical protein